MLAHSPVRETVACANGASRKT